MINLLRWLFRIHPRPHPEPIVPEKGRDMMVTNPPPSDEKMDMLRTQYQAAHARLTLVQAEVRAMQVDAGVIQRDYHPPRRIARDEGNQSA